MPTRNDFMAVLRHETPESVPICTKPLFCGIGFFDPFEKGPAGGGLDGFGVLWNSTPDGPTPSTASFVLTDVTQWESQVRFPDLDAIDWESKAQQDLAKFDPETQVLEYAMGNGTFERLIALMGYENFIYALDDEPEACQELIEAFDAYRIGFVDRIAHYYNPDFITVFDDVAFGRGLFVSQDAYREFIKPSHKKVFEAISGHGIIPVNHCCGKAEVLVEDFIEEGAAAWANCQPLNDIAALLENYGDRLSIIGGFDSQGVPGSIGATEEDRRGEVRRCIDTYAPLGNFVLGNVAVLTKTPEERNLFTRQIYDEADTYGKDYYRR